LERVKCQMLQCNCTNSKRRHSRIPGTHCSVLQCVAVHCSALQCVAVCCSGITVQVHELTTRAQRKHAWVPSHVTPMKITHSFHTSTLTHTTGFSLVPSFSRVHFLFLSLSISLSLRTHTHTHTHTHTRIRTRTHAHTHSNRNPGHHNLNLNP